jgi:tRNA (cmo5U34)-methyltransferase
LLSQYLFKYFPNFRYTLIDVSGKMLDIAKKRFKNLSNIVYLGKYYANNFLEGNFDLIASALSIHNLSEKEKCKLYKNIFSSLNKNGFF